jgi:hypothetical protein
MNFSRRSNMESISVINSEYMNMNLDMEERVVINPTDPHDRNTFKENELEYLNPNTEVIESEEAVRFGDSLLFGFGPEFFEDEKLTKQFYHEKISNAKPYEVIRINSEKLYLDELLITAPVKFIGTGKTTLYIKNRVIIDYKN